MSRPKDDISIAMTTYNGARHLQQQLDSFAHQTVLPSQLVVTDDGSTDATQEVVESFAKSAPFPVHFVRNERRLGFRDNFLKAAGLCRSTFVAFSDQDDFWLEEKIEKSMARLRTDGTDLCIHTAHIGNEELEKTGLLKQGISEDRVIGPLHALPLPGMSFGFTITFRRDLLDILNPSLRPPQPQEEHEVVFHDLWVYFLAFVFGRISEMTEPLAIYRQHRQMTSSGAQVPPPASRIVPLPQYEFRARFAADCADALDKGSATLSGVRREQAKRGAEYCRQLEGRIRRRIGIYEERRALSRAASVLSLAATGGYGPTKHAGLGHQSAIKDVVLGVLGFGLVEPR
jgi:hypothetical protein